MAENLDLGNLLVHLRADATQYMRVMRAAEARMKSTAASITKIGRQMAMRVTLPFVIMGGLATKTMADLESAFTGVRKTVDATEKEFEQLKLGFEKMSILVPISIKELYGIGEAAGQLGIQTKNILKFSRVMADLGVTTNLTAQEASMALARFANITQMSQNDFDRLGSTIVDLGNNLATTEAEIVTMSLRMAGAGKVVGLTEHAIMSLASAVSSVGIQAEAGGSAMSRVLLDMSSYVKQGGAELEALAKVARVTTKEFAESFEQNAAESIYLFVKGLNEANKAGADVTTILEKFGWQGIRIIRVLLGLAGANNVLEESLDIGGRAWKENTALTKEAELRYGTFASQVIMLKNKFVLISKEIGLMLKPAVLNLIGIIKRMTVYWDLMKDSVKRNILVYAGIAAAIGPVLLATGLLIKSLSFIITTVNTLTASFIGLIVVMSGPIAVILLLAAIAYTLYAAWKQNLEAIKDRMQEWFNAFSAGITWLINTPVFRSVKEFGRMWIETFKFIGKEGKTFFSNISALASGSIAWWVRVGVGIQEAWNAQTFGEMWTKFKNEWDAAPIDFANAFLEQADKADAALNTFYTNVKSQYESSVITLEAFGKATIEHLEQLMSTLKTQFGQDADAVIALIKSKMLKLKEVSLPIPSTDIAEITAEIEKLKNAYVPVIQRSEEFLENQKDAKAIMNEMLRSLDLEYSLLGKISEERERAMQMARFEKIANEALTEEYITQLEYKKQIEDYEKGIKKIIEGRKGYEAAFKGPLAQWASDAGNHWEQLGNIATGTLDGIADSFTDLLIDGTMTFRQLADSVIRDITRMMIKWSMAQMVMGFLGAATGMPLTSTVTSGGAYGNGMATMHNGGIVPRLHNGLAADEFPVILQSGEQVLSKKEVAESKSQSEGGGSKTVNINVSAINSQDTYAFLNRNKNAIASMMQTSQRNNHPIRRG